MSYAKVLSFRPGLLREQCLVEGAGPGHCGPGVEALQVFGEFRPRR
jgi:hypothetical protein